jgi:peroxiredoxin (alkyl hydroperoxide reductase subunit C)
MCDPSDVAHYGHHHAEETPRIPLIGEVAPAFQAVTTQGPIRFPEDFEGSWVILFSHPADFTPVCTTEFVAFATLAPQFETLNCKLLGLSIDSNYSHIAWLRAIKEKIKYKGMEGVEVRFPVIADLKMEVARKYGMVQASTDDSHAVRAVFIIDPETKVRVVLYYPISTGRFFPEILRILVALQATDRHGVATPADWQPGDPVIVPPPGSCGVAQERVESKEEGIECLDWYLCLKELPKEHLDLPPMWKEE